MVKVKEPLQPVNFVDLRRPAVQNGNVISDVLRPAKTSKKRRLLLRVAVALVSVLIAGAAIVLWPHRGLHVPKEINTNLGFQVYYPSKLPSGYVYKANTASVQGGIVFFTFVNGSRSISVSQQALPSSPPDLQHLQSFKTFDTKLGKGAIGSANGGSTAIFVADATLITVNTVPADKAAVLSVAESLDAIH